MEVIEVGGGGMGDSDQFHNRGPGDDAAVLRRWARSPRPPFMPDGDRQEDTGSASMAQGDRLHLCSGAIKHHQVVPLRWAGKRRPEQGASPRHLRTCTPRHSVGTEPDSEKRRPSEKANRCERGLRKLFHSDSYRKEYGLNHPRLPGWLAQVESGGFNLAKPE